MISGGINVTKILVKVL